MLLKSRKLEVGSWKIAGSKQLAKVVGRFVTYQNFRDAFRFLIILNMCFQHQTFYLFSTFMDGNEISQ